jgi:hypothetical protein
MAFSHGIAAKLSINGGTAIEGYVEGIEAAFTRALAEVRTLTGEAVIRVAGLEDFQFTVNGGWDATLDAAVYTGFHAAAAAAVVFQPEGTTTYTVNCWIPEYNITASSTDAAKWSIRLASAGTCVRS